MRDDRIRLSVGLAQVLLPEKPKSAQTARIQERIVNDGALSDLRRNLRDNCRSPEKDAFEQITYPAKRPAGSSSAYEKPAHEAPVRKRKSTLIAAAPLLQQCLSKTVEKTRTPERGGFFGFLSGLYDTLITSRRFKS